MPVEWASYIKLMLTKCGEVKILDFGLVKLRDQTKFTKAGSPCCAQIIAPRVKLIYYNPFGAVGIKGRVQ